MEEQYLLEQIVEQNRDLLANLKLIADKLSDIHDELQWHKDLTAAAKILESLEGIRQSVDDATR